MLNALLFYFAEILFLKVLKFFDENLRKIGVNQGCFFANQGFCKLSL